MCGSGTYWGARDRPDRFGLVLAGCRICTSSQKDMEQKLCLSHVTIIALSSAIRLRPNELAVEFLENLTPFEIASYQHIVVVQSIVRDDRNLLELRSL